MELTVEQIAQTVKETNGSLKAEILTATQKEFEGYKLNQETLQAEFEKQKQLMIQNGATIGQIVEEQKNFNAKIGRFQPSNEGRKTTKMNQVAETVYQYLQDNSEMLAKVGEGASINTGQMKIKASAVSSASLATYPYVNFLPWQPGMEPIGQYRIRQLLSTIPSDFDTVEFPRANTPVGAGSFSQQLTEGNAKDQVDRGWTMVQVILYTIAGYIIVSRQSLRNIPFMQTWLPTSLNEQLLDQEDNLFANALVAAATGSTTGVTVGTTINVEAITILIKNLMKKKWYPNAVALDPDVWQKILVTKAVTSGQYSLPVGSVGITPAGDVTILGKPIYPVNWLTGGRCLIGDWSKAAIVESQSLTFLQSDSHASTFIANQITFLLERTENIAIFRPDAFVTCLLTAAT